MFFLARKEGRISKGYSTRTKEMYGWLNYVEKCVLKIVNEQFETMTELNKHFNTHFNEDGEWFDNGQPNIPSYLFRKSCGKFIFDDRRYEEICDGTRFDTCYNIIKKTYGLKKLGIKIIDENWNKINARELMNLNGEIDVIEDE
jgi:hypothetical protein